MFGSDQGVWPEVIAMAIESIDRAEFLTAAQKRDIFYNNAARFFRLGAQRAATLERPFLLTPPSHDRIATAAEAGHDVGSSTVRVKGATRH